MSDDAPGIPAAAADAQAGPLDRVDIDAAPLEEATGDEPATEAGGPVSDALVTGLPGLPPASTLPGAYMPPSVTHRPPPATLVQPSAAAPPMVGTPSPAAGAWTPPSPVAPPAPVAQPGRASLFADLPFDAPDSISEWLVAVGASAASISFLLPWVSGTTSYLTSWGFSAPSRLPILALLVATAVLGILPNRVSLWVRAGVLGLVGGSLFLGNIWPIVAGDFGDAGFGAILGAAAALVLIVGGILAVAPRRTEADAG